MQINLFQNGSESQKSLLFTFSSRKAQKTNLIILICTQFYTNIREIKADEY